MEIIGPASVVTCILLVSFQPLTVTSVVTSYEKLRFLVNKGDGALIQGIEDAIKVREERIKKLTIILKQHFGKPKEDYQFQVDHPNDFYLLVKHHVDTWYVRDIDEALHPALTEVIKSQNITFPVLEDFADAALALVRLQFVYKLKAQDMFEGNYLGYLGSSLEMEDTFLLGNHAFMSGHLPEAKEWLQMSVDMLTEAMEDQSPSDWTSLQEQYVSSLSLLGRTHFYMNETETARKLHEQCDASERVPWRRVPRAEVEVSGIEDAEELRKELDAENFTKLLEEYGPSVSDIDENITALCSREKNHRLSAVRPYHVCRYKSDPFLPYRRFREEILSTSPYASVFYDVIYDEEIEKLKNISIEAGLTRAGVTGGRSKGGISDVRTGDLNWVHDDADPLVARVSQRVKAFTRLDVTKRQNRRSSSESLQVLNYGMGGHYDVHLDSLRDDSVDDRLATVLFYLTDVEKGGATIFPKVGISVSPVKGMALLWYSYPPDIVRSDPDTLHAGCPVMIGNKWIANKWIWTYGNTFRRPCGPSPQSQQLDVEKIVSLDALKEIIE